MIFWFAMKMDVFIIVIYLIKVINMEKRKYLTYHLKEEFL